ncbi:MAG: hypothetical protein ABIQ31_08140 [Ferruginibacter sp.]
MSAIKIYLTGLAIVLVISLASCNKHKASTDELCGVNRATVLVADDFTGQLAYNTEMGKWVINVAIPGTYDGLRTCIVCDDIADELKVQGLIVVFSGDLKESNGYQRPQLGGQEIYYVNPTKLKKP